MIKDQAISIGTCYIADLQETSTNVDTATIARYLGHQKSTFSPSQLKKVDSIKSEGLAFISYKSVYGVWLTSTLPTVTWAPHATHIAFGLVTIGAELESECSRLMTLGQKDRAIILDALGSEAAEKGAATLHKLILEKAQQLNLYGFCRKSPGYEDWPLSYQKNIFNVLQKSSDIGVSLNDSMLMTPRKSITFAIALSSDKTSAKIDFNTSATCDSCNLKTCSFRKRT